MRQRAGRVLPAREGPVIILWSLILWDLYDGGTVRQNRFARAFSLLGVVRMGSWMFPAKPQSTTEPRRRMGFPPKTVLRALILWDLYHGGIVRQNRFVRAFSSLGVASEAVMGVSICFCDDKGVLLACGA